MPILQQMHKHQLTSSYVYSYKLFVSGNVIILSVFSQHSKSFNSKQLGFTRILILRVLLAVCYTCRDDSGIDMEVGGLTLIRVISMY